MIPVSLSIAGFLSYLDPVFIDFNGFELACISGRNGAGKSSLLDAITWALFGQARKTGEALLNTAAKAAEVALVFRYENNTYCIQRTLPRGKTSVLEFQIQQTEQAWKTLTEATLRATQARIEQTLHLDYDTFVNASFFLQGKADQFTQQRPTDRKRILSSILGLEAWENYREQTAARRKGFEANIAALDGRLAEIAAELKEEKQRQEHLLELEQEMDRLAKSRAVQESTLETIRKITATLAEQRKLVEALSRQVHAATQRLDETLRRSENRQAERVAHLEWLGRAAAIHQAYADWQADRAALEQWEHIASQFRQHEQRRQPFLDEINFERVRLQQEQQALQAQQYAQTVRQAEADGLQAQVTHAQATLAEIEGRLSQRAELDASLQTARQRQADARAENPRLKIEMDELKARIDQLKLTEGAACPLCGQPLPPAERETLIQSLQAQGTQLGLRYRANLVVLNETDDKVREVEKALAGLAKTEKERLAQIEALAQTITHLEHLRQELFDWQQNAAPRLVEVQEIIKNESFALAARAALAQVDADLKSIGYDAAAHEQTRRQEQSERSSEIDLRALESAQAALQPLEREIAELESAVQRQTAEAQQLRTEYDHLSASLLAAQAAAPDLWAAERELFTIQEHENRLRLEVGAARQKVLVLEDLKTRQKALAAQRAELARAVSQHKTLERAFGKDGIPALLIEQALPQIESRANDLLDRLSAGAMTVRFITQSAYKDKKRDDLKETLDIQISDSAGTRDYEMFSGGEAFRINFAIRLALSEVLAQRAGARLQTLVIDEGFGSQDAQGRQRLVEAINLVKKDFAKILVITHIDELKDAFPCRIEVEKTGRGSMVTIL